MKNKERTVFGQVLVNANLKDVWEAWTTEEGARSFFAPECEINLIPGGAYEMYFAPKLPRGSRGGEGCQVLAVQPMKMLSFTWNAPPELADVRNQFTHVIIRFNDTPQGVLITLHHDGWGMGGEWDQAFNYFDAAWNEVVLPRLQYRFAHGPINWQAPPDL